MDQGSRIEDQGSRIKDQGSRMKDLLWGVRLQELKNKGKVLVIVSESVRGRLWECLLTRI